jgi:hypothetical protein
MLVNENRILDLWVYANNPVSIQCNQDELIKCNDLVLPCGIVGEKLLTTAKEKRYGSFLK